MGAVNTLLNATTEEQERRESMKLRGTLSRYSESKLTWSHKGGAQRRIKYVETIYVGCAYVITHKIIKKGEKLWCLSQKSSNRTNCSTDSCSKVVMTPSVRKPIASLFPKRSNEICGSDNHNKNTSQFLMLRVTQKRISKVWKFCVALCIKHNIL